MSNLIVQNKENWLAIKEQAQAVKQAGLLPQAMTAEQAAVIVLKGQELGIGTMRALEGLYVVNGKIGMSANLVMGLIRERCPKAKIVVKRKDDQGCVIEAERPGQSPETFSFVLKDAQAAGLIKPGSPWQKYPSSMYWSRCVTNMGRQLFSDILGASYTPEELGGHVEEEEIHARILGSQQMVELRQSNPSEIKETVSNGKASNSSTKIPPEPKGASVSLLNDRIMGMSGDNCHEPFNQEIFQATPKDSTLTVTAKPASRPETIDVSTGEVVQDDFPAFDQFEDSKPAKVFDDKKELTHWDRLASSGPNSGKTLRTIYQEVGKDNFIKMYVTSTSKIAKMKEEGKTVPKTTLDTYKDLTACCEELENGIR